MKAVTVAGGLADTRELLAHKNHILTYHLEANLLPVAAIAHDGITK